MIALVVCIVLVLLLGLVLLTPFQLWIDSPRQRYQLRWGRWISADLVPVQGDLRVQVGVLGWRKSYSLWALLRKRSTSPSKRKNREEKLTPPRRNSLSWARVLKLLRSFRVKHWRLDIDTDDVIWNAYLFPASYFLRRAHYPVHVNYDGRVEVELLVENRPLWIIRALIF